MEEQIEGEEVGAVAIGLEREEEGEGKLGRLAKDRKRGGLGGRAGGGGEAEELLFR